MKLPLPAITASRTAVVLAALPLLVLPGAGLAYWGIWQSAPKPVVKTVAQPTGKEQALTVRNESDLAFIGAGHYTGEQSSKSKIDKTELGDLYRVSKPGEARSFVVATGDPSKPSDLATQSGWRATLVGRDAMWVPGACAQKPSWMVGDRYILIDDGEYTGAQATHYYALYNTVDKTFIDFGGSLVNDTQAKEKIMFVNVEDGKIVFYIDQQDGTGPFASSTSFKHSTANHDPYLIRRVVDVPDLTYADYRIAYDQPSFDAYHVNVMLGQAGVMLQVVAEGGGTTLYGAITTGQAVSLSRLTFRAPVSPLTPYAADIARAFAPDTEPGSLPLGDAKYATASSSYYVAGLARPLVYNASTHATTFIMSDDTSRFYFVLGAQ